MMDVYGVVDGLLVERCGVHFSEEGGRLRGFFVGLCVKFGGEEVLEAWGIACGGCDGPVTAFSKLGGILYNRGFFSSFIERV